MKIKKKATCKAGSAKPMVVRKSVEEKKTNCNHRHYMIENKNGKIMCGTCKTIIGEQSPRQ